VTPFLLSRGAEKRLKVVWPIVKAPQSILKGAPTMSKVKQTNRKQRRQNQPDMSKADFMSRARMQAWMEVQDELKRSITSTCEMYSISLAMVLTDKYHQTPEQITAVLRHVEKLCDEFNDGLLSIADCRRTLIDEQGLVIGDEEIYKRLETGGDQMNGQS
jgi:hypothetical protein